MDMLIVKSPYLTSAQDRASLLSRQAMLQSLGPFSYLTSGGCAGEIWEECLQNFVSAFQETRVRPHEYLRCLENIKRLAVMLDRCIPQLSEEVRKYSQVLPTALRNAECMQATMKGLIATAMAAFDLYKPRGEHMLRIHGPVLSKECSNATESNSSLDVKPCPLRLSSGTLITTSLQGSDLELVAHITTPIPTTQRSPPARPLLLPTGTTPTNHLLLLGYPTLQALTFLTCVVACVLQLRAYALAAHEPGALDDADFYNNLQSILMQLLTTYTGLVPVARGSPRRRRRRGLLASAFWLAGLSVAGAALNFAAVGAYFRDGALAPLLGFFGNVVQALLVLQLAISLDDSRGVVALLDEG